MTNFVIETMHFVAKLMSFVLTMMSFDPNKLYFVNITRAYNRMTDASLKMLAVVRFH